MINVLMRLWSDDHGFVISAELVLVLTVGVLMMVVGLHSMSKAITQELNDLSNSFGAIQQTYKYDGFKKPWHSFVAGSAFFDAEDECDCTAIVQIKPNPKFDNGSGPENGGGYGGHGGYK